MTKTKKTTKSLTGEKDPWSKIAIEAAQKQICQKQRKKLAFYYTMTTKPNVLEKVLGRFHS